MAAIDEFKEWLVTAGLYQKKSFGKGHLEPLAKEIGGDIKVDCYCTSCKNTSTFGASISKRYNPIPTSIGGNNMPLWEQARSYLAEAMPTFLVMHCARDWSHTLSFWLSKVTVDDTIIFTKLGQWPSQHDLSASELRRYAKLLDEQDMREMQAASICHSAGYSVAAFTYLRRVFERRIEHAHVIAKDDAGWQEPDYSPTARMEDRIEMLRGHLPPFLVEHKKLYNILSRGIHELTETECAEGYDVAHLGITLILDEEIEREARAQKIAAASKSIKQLHQKYTSGE